MNDMMEERKKVIKLIRNRYILAISLIWIVNSKSDNFFKGLIAKLNWG